MSESYDVIVIGAGPAGYVAALRCAQLGLRTACVDDWLDADGRPALGGTCLNAGCIPSKALLESSELYDRMQRDVNAHGIGVSGLSLDVPAMVAEKNAIVRDLTSGIAALFSTSRINWIPGRGRLLPERQVSIDLHTGDQMLKLVHDVLPDQRDRQAQR